MQAKRVLLTRRMPPPAAEMLCAAGFAVDQIDSDAPPTREEFLERVRGVAGLIPMLSDRIDTALLDAAGPSLRVVANYAVGFDNVDIAACTERGVRVSNTPGVLTDAAADLTWTLILAAARRVVEGDRLVRTDAWRGWVPIQLLGLQLSGATLGLVGAGRIGTAVGLRSAGFRMRVLYADLHENRELEQKIAATRVELDTSSPKPTCSRCTSLCDPSITI